MMLQESHNMPKATPEICQHDIREEVQMLLDVKSPISKSVRKAQLMYLSHWFPNEVLDTLLKQLHYEDDAPEPSASDQHLWHCVLASEEADLPGNSDIAVPVFELICNLLYKHKPEKMLKFLQRAQKVWDHKVGMSAFVRRRQTLMVYERALKCLPEPEHSVDKLTAIQVHTNILLTSEEDGCFLKAIRLLLRYERWEESIDLLAEYRDRCRQYVLLYQMVLSSLTKNNKLHVYADKIFPLMPQFNSCDNIPKGDNQDLPTEIFAGSEGTVSIDCVRPHLLKSLGHGSDNGSASTS